MSSQSALNSDFSCSWQNQNLPSVCPTEGKQSSEQNEYSVVCEGVESCRLTFPQSSCWSSGEGRLCGTTLPVFHLNSSRHNEQSCDTCHGSFRKSSLYSPPNSHIPWHPISWALSRNKFKNIYCSLLGMYEVMSAEKVRSKGHGSRERHSLILGRQFIPFTWLNSEGFDIWQPEFFSQHKVKFPH